MVGALAVVGVHLYKHDVLYGYIGVELFFLISGFVILMSAQGATLSEFVMARAVRLFPAFWICCTLTWLVCEQASGFGEYVGNLLTLGQVHAMDGVYWTLGVEVKFYASIAALILLGRLEQIEWFLWGWLAVAALPVGQTLEGLLSTHVTGCFVGGCAIYLLRNPSRSRWALLVCAWLVQLYNEDVRMDGLGPVWWPIALFVTLAFAAVFLASRVKGYRWMMYLGGLSYPLYLIHDRIGLLLQEDYGWLAVPAVILLAMGAYKLEKPLQRRVRSALVIRTGQPDHSGHGPEAHHPRQADRPSHDGEAAGEH